MHPGLIIGEYDRVKARGDHVRRQMRRRPTPPPILRAPPLPEVSRAFVDMLDATIAELDKRQQPEQSPATIPISPRRIMATVCEKFDVPPGFLLARTRRHEIARPRFAYIALLHELMGWSYTQVGRYVDFDHTSCIAAVRRCHEIRQENPAYSDRYHAALAALTNPAGGAR